MLGLHQQEGNNSTDPGAEEDADDQAGVEEGLWPELLGRGEEAARFPSLVVHVPSLRKLFLP